MPSPTLVIYNPIAGRGRVRATWPLVEHALHDAGISFDAVATEGPRHATALAEAAAGSYSCIVSVGGDGTAHEIVNGLLRASEVGAGLAASSESSDPAEMTCPISLGIIPLGNGDDFAKMLPPETPIGGHPFDWRAAVQKIARGQTQLYDVVRMVGQPAPPETGEGPHYFVNVMDIGFGAAASLNFRRVPKFFKGMAAYLAAVVMTLVAYPRLRLRLQMDDSLPFDQGTTMAAIANGRCFGNGFWICPDARADDGLLDVMVVDAVGRLTILQLLPKVMKGTHLGAPVIHAHRGRRVVIDAAAPFVVEADGELPYVAARHLEVEVLPRRLRMAV